MPAKSPKSRVRETDTGLEFDVTIEEVVGSVVVGDNGSEQPEVVAFRLIAESEREGVFHFPSRDGRTFNVDVSLTDER